MPSKIRFYNNTREQQDETKAILTKIIEYSNPALGYKILDVLTGYANFAIALAKFNRKREIVGVEISPDFIKVAKRNIKKAKCSSNIEVVNMDARKLSFQDNSFDSVVNFLGWGDLTILHGKTGIKKVIREMVRVLKPGGNIMLSFLLVAKPKNKISEIDQNLIRYLWRNKRRHYGEETFLSELKKYNIRSIRKKIIFTSGKRISPKIAKKDLKFLQKEFGNRCRSYQDVYSKYGNFIDRYGLVGSEAIVVLIGHKPK